MGDDTFVWAIADRVPLPQARYNKNRTARMVATGIGISISLFHESKIYPMTRQRSSAPIPLNAVAFTRIGGVQPGPFLLWVNSLAKQLTLTRKALTLAVSTAQAGAQFQLRGELLSSTFSTPWRHVGPCLRFRRGYAYSRIIGER